MKARLFQGRLDRLDDARHPRVLRPCVVRGEQGRVEQRGDPAGQLARRGEHLRLAHARLQEWNLNLFVPERGIGIRDPTEVLAPDPQLLFDRVRTHPGGDRHLEQLDRFELVHPHPILRRWARVAVRLPDRRQQAMAQSRVPTDVRERLVAQAAEPIPVVVVEELEGEVAVADDLADGLQRHPTLLQPQEEAGPPHIPARERVRVVRDDEVGIDQPIDVADGDADTVRKRFACDPHNNHHRSPGQGGIVTTFVLIHGAGDSGWYWHLVEAELRARGHDTVAPDLPVDGSTLTECAAAVVEAVGTQTAPVVVVGQSFGGFIAPLVAARLPTEVLVLVAGMVPSPGEAPDDWWENTGYGPAVREQAAIDGGLTGNEDPSITFFHDVPATIAEEAMRRERGGSIGGLDQPWPLEAWPAMPTRFVLCTEDRFFPAAFCRRLVDERLGIVPDEIESGHCVALSRPVELADLLDGYVT